MRLLADDAENVESDIVDQNKGKDGVSQPIDFRGPSSFLPCSPSQTTTIQGPKASSSFTKETLDKSSDAALNATLQKEPALILQSDFKTVEKKLNMLENLINEKPRTSHMPSRVHGGSILSKKQDEREQDQEVLGQERLDMKSEYGHQNRGGSTHVTQLLAQPVSAQEQISSFEEPYSPDKPHKAGAAPQSSDIWSSDSKTAALELSGAKQRGRVAKAKGPQQHAVPTRYLSQIPLPLQNLAKRARKADK